MDIEIETVPLVENERSPAPTSERPHGTFARLQWGWRATAHPSHTPVEITYSVGLGWIDVVLVLLVLLATFLTGMLVQFQTHFLR